MTTEEPAKTKGKMTDAEILKRADQIRDREDRTKNAERRKQTIADIGKCFRATNSYGDGRQWWLYIKIIGVGAEGYPKTIKFQTIPKNTFRAFEIKFDDYDLCAARAERRSNMLPITAKKFYSELRKAIARAERLAFNDRRH